MNADDIRQALDTKTRQINGQRNLTPQAKRTMIARAFIEARNALDQLKADEVDRIHREREKHERKLFGTTGFNPDPNAVIARRDANDRAAKLETPVEAEHAMRRAEREGDSIMAKAIAARAADYSGDPGWSNVVRAYVADKPNEAATLQAMQDLPDTNDGVWRMRQAIEYSVSTPSELGDNVHPHQVDAIASRSLDGDAAA
ncbi:hypothetical protein [Streptomyces sp. WAC05950]|uniref:hypothetical protein n=1 Tax=Streptomyces sp. WAC05950 TaxID=2487419 RepID=UPI000F742BB7|nr:hypothetical protein [Streptomyces sp. WAC05950]RST13469.1 hypothetical protein EF904_07240 [Streptomyces sp. WAC05950]